MQPPTSPVIGTTKGPGETPHEFTLVTSDMDRTVKIGEFVFYRAKLEGVDREVFGRVVHRAPLRVYPDGFMADPGVPPNSIAGMLGFDDGDYELFEVRVSVLGYYDAALQDFINPHVLPQSGTPVCIASDRLLDRVLSKKGLGEIGALHIGSLLSRSVGAVPVVVDARAVTSTHLAIIAGTGAGKSYLGGVLIEELMGPQNRAAVLVVDPHGEYQTLRDLTQIRYDDAPAYKPQVQVFRPDEIKLRISSLSLNDMSYLLPDLSDRMRWRLAQALRSVRRARGERWTLADLLQQLRQKSRDDDSEDEEEGGSATNRALAWRLESTFAGSPTFDDSENLRLQALFRPGLCTVLQMHEIDRRQQRVIVAALLRRVLRARMNTEKGLEKERSELHLPYPVFVFLEEAHHFAPASGDTVSSEILKTILAEGRKFGVAVGLVSQRPGKLDPDVLSQCMTLFAMRIVNPRDQDSVAESVESAGADLLAELPALSKGQTIVAGAGVNTPMLCRVRRRLTRHGAEDPDAPARWISYSDEGKTASSRQQVATAS